MNFKGIGSLLLFLLLCTPVVYLGALMLGAVRGQIEQLEAEAAANAEIKEDLVQLQRKGASLVEELATARGESERLKAEAAANAEV
jgi:hypothetical protein